ncbi:hypothetical protein BBD41_06885 [Paenibacillus ihbetae]|uniref:Uncharacterized protein n=1 Tax=Paenibacillus ihbetae TaxID=1870820 RepID=A0A1B2DXB6_9BACL|nr:hypothetical protein [Paenibacillus ihbetae]ANY72339.1 hypothetical protein BBD41_06885 [Paenibacillus ihbetae]
MSEETDSIWNEELGKVEHVGWSFTGRIDLPQPEGVWSDQLAKKQWSLNFQIEAESICKKTWVHVMDQGIPQSNAIPLDDAAQQ